MKLKDWAHTDVRVLVDGLNFAQKVERALRLIELAHDEYREGLVVANSLGKDSCVVWHLAKQVSDDIRGFIVTTRYKPAETKRFMAEVVDRHPELRVYKNDAPVPDRMYETDPNHCCDLLKVQPTRRAIEEMDVACWVTGLRCTEGRTRTDFQEVEERDAGLIKLNPILIWHEREIWQYLSIYNVPVNPLYKEGYRSLGCAPCSKITSGGDERAGRWIGTSKCGGECGIHTRPLKRVFPFRHAIMMSRYSVAIGNHVPFPCKEMPTDGRLGRLLGIYPQRSKGRFFQRIRVPGGLIDARQWQGLASLAERYAPGYPLHLTTRQDVELHGVSPENIPPLQHGVWDIGLSCAGACGDTVRNITYCPGNGFKRGTWDVSELASAIQAKVQSLDWITDLPRKFKITVCGCFESCTRPWINDLGLVANRDGTFKAVVAGSLGAKPGTGIVLHETLSAARVLPLAVALLRLFHAEGDRTRRHRARLRHVRERLGDEVFRSRAEALFQEEVQKSEAGGPGIVRVADETPLRARLCLPLGDITPEAAMKLSSAATASGAILRIGLDHELLLYGRRPIDLSPDLQALSASPPVVACPGFAWCTKGIVDSRLAAEQIGRRVKLPSGVAVAISGCPNNCSEAPVAPIGLVGRIQRVGGRTVPGFRILAGGGRGRGPELARQICGFVPAERVDAAVGSIVDEYIQVSERDGPLDFNRFLSEEHESLTRSVEELHGVSIRGLP